MKRFLTSILIFTVSFQMALASTITRLNSRVPAGWGHEIELEKLEKELDAYKVKIVGKDIESDCQKKEVKEQQEEVEVADASEESIDWENYDFGADSFNVINKESADKEFDRIVGDLKVNSCGQYVYSFDKKEEKKEEVCKPRRIKGLIELSIEKTMREEADEKEPTPFKLDDKQIRGLHAKAEFYLREVRKFLADRDLEIEKRRSLLIKYLDSVALPMRDLIVVKRAYIPQEYNGVFFYESLLPEFPTKLFPPQDQMGREKIYLGPNPSQAKFHLKIVDSKWGKSTLKYDHQEIMQRDILTLIKAPTTKNYVRALKWMTLHMMMSQVYLYNSILEEDKAIEVPKSCRNQFNGDMPDEFKFSFKPGAGQNFLDMLLTKHGLIFSNENYMFLEYFRDNPGKDPTKDGYSGLVPFEQYKYSKVGMAGEKRAGLIPDMDDFSYFEDIMNIKGAEARAVFKDETSSLLGLRESRPYTYLGSEILEKILKVPTETDAYEIETKDGETIEIDALRQNVSIYMAELMTRNGVEYFEDLITDKLKNKLKGRVKIEFPSLHGASIWRQWALNELAMFAEENKNKDFKTNPQLKKSLSMVCVGTNRRSSLCKQGASKLLSNVSDLLSEFNQNGEYIPTRRLYEKNFEKVYPLLKRLWNRLRDSNLLSSANPVEEVFLIDQVKAGNPWARTRLSYLLAIDELESFKAGYQPVYKTSKRAARGYQNQSFCFYRNVNSILDKLKEAGDELGLNKAISINHGNKILDQDEKEYVWQQYMDQLDEGTSRLLVQNDRSGKDYYDQIEKVSYKTLISREGVENLEKQLPHGLRADAWENIEQVLDSERGKHSEFFLKLYKAKGDIKKQTEMFQEYAEKNGLSSSSAVKQSFLMMENDLKRPIYASLLKSSARLRKVEVIDRLDEFCTMEPDNHEKLQALFHATSKAQNQLNQLAGKPAVPNEVLDRINDKISSMSPSEKVDMLLGIGAGVLGVAAILIGGACTGVTGGLCAPLGVTMMAAGASAMGMQMALVKRELDRKKNADVFERQVKNMEDLGFANHGSSSNVSRNWFWTAFEAVSIIPLIGVLARSVKVGTKLTFVSSRMILKNWGKVGMKESMRMAGIAGRTVVTEADVSFARYVLGFSKGLEHYAADAADLGIKGVSKKVAEETIKKVKKIHFLFKTGKISSESMTKQIGKIMAWLKGLAKSSDELATYTSKVVVTETPKQIDKQTAKVVSRYFGNNPNAMAGLMKTYSKKLVKANKAMEIIKQGKTPWLRIPFTNHFLTTKKVPVIGSIWNWVRKLRMEHLAKNSAKINRLERGLLAWGKQGKSLEDYVLHNMDDFTDLFKDIPMRWRELPYMFLLQGGPHVGGPLAGKRIPYMSALADGLILRKMFNARSRLIYESMKSQARTMLGLKKYVGAETALQSIRAFQDTLTESLETAGEKEGRLILMKYKQMQIKVADKIYNHNQKLMAQKGWWAKLKKTMRPGKSKVLAEAANFDKSKLKQLLFAPADSEERVMADILLESMNPEDLFDLREVGEVAHRVIRELSKYEGVDGFQRYLNALKVLVIKRDPGVVEIM